MTENRNRILEWIRNDQVPAIHEAIQNAKLDHGDHLPLRVLVEQPDDSSGNSVGALAAQLLDVLVACPPAFQLGGPESSLANVETKCSELQSALEQLADIGPPERQSSPDARANQGDPDPDRPLAQEDSSTGSGSLRLDPVIEALAIWGLVFGPDSTIGDVYAIDVPETLRDRRISDFLTVEPSQLIDLSELLNELTVANTDGAEIDTSLLPDWVPIMFQLFTTNSDPLSDSLAFVKRIAPTTADPGFWAVSLGELALAHASTQRDSSTDSAHIEQFEKTFCEA